MDDDHLSNIFQGPIALKWRAMMAATIARTSSKSGRSIYSQFALGFDALMVGIEVAFALSTTFVWGEDGKVTLRHFGSMMFWLNPVVDSPAYAAAIGTLIFLALFGAIGMCLWVPPLAVHLSFAFSYPLHWVLVRVAQPIMGYCIYFITYRWRESSVSAMLSFIFMVTCVLEHVVLMMLRVVTASSIVKPDRLFASVFPAFQRHMVVVALDLAESLAFFHGGRIAWREVRITLYLVLLCGKAVLGVLQVLRPVCMRCFTNDVLSARALMAAIGCAVAVVSELAPRLQLRLWFMPLYVLLGPVSYVVVHACGDWAQRASSQLLAKLGAIERDSKVLEEALKAISEGEIENLVRIGIVSNMRVIASNTFLRFVLETYPRSPFFTAFAVFAHATVIDDDPVSYRVFLNALSNGSLWGCAELIGFQLTYAMMQIGEIESPAVARAMAGFRLYTTYAAKQAASLWLLDPTSAREGGGYSSIAEVGVLIRRQEVRLGVLRCVFPFAPDVEYERALFMADFLADYVASAGAFDRAERMTRLGPRFVRQQLAAGFRGLIPSRRDNLERPPEPGEALVFLSAKDQHDQAHKYVTPVSARDAHTKAIAQAFEIRRAHLPSRAVLLDSEGLWLPVVLMVVFAGWTICAGMSWDAAVRLGNLAYGAGERRGLLAEEAQRRRELELLARDVYTLFDLGVSGGGENIWEVVAGEVPTWAGVGGPAEIAEFMRTRVRQRDVTAQKLKFCHEQLGMDMQAFYPVWTTVEYGLIRLLSCPDLVLAVVGLDEAETESGLSALWPFSCAQRAEVIRREEEEQNRTWARCLHGTSWGLVVFLLVTICSAVLARTRLTEGQAMIERMAAAVPPCVRRFKSQESCKVLVFERDSSPPFRMTRWRPFMWGVIAVVLVVGSSVLLPVAARYVVEPPSSRLPCSAPNISEDEVFRGFMEALLDFHLREESSLTIFYRPAVAAQYFGDTHEDESEVHDPALSREAIIGIWLGVFFLWIVVMVMVLLSMAMKAREVQLCRRLFVGIPSAACRGSPYYAEVREGRPIEASEVNDFVRQMWDVPKDFGDSITTFFRDDEISKIRGDVQKVFGGWEEIGASVAKLEAYIGGRARVVRGSELSVIFERRRDSVFIQESRDGTGFELKWVSRNELLLRKAELPTAEPELEPAEAWLPPKEAHNFFAVLEVEVVALLRELRPLATRHGVVEVPSAGRKALFVAPVAASMRAFVVSVATTQPRVRGLAMEGVVAFSSVAKFFKSRVMSIEIDAAWAVVGTWPYSTVRVAAALAGVEGAPLPVELPGVGTVPFLDARIPALCEEGVEVQSAQSEEVGGRPEGE